MKNYPQSRPMGKKRLVPAKKKKQTKLVLDLRFRTMLASIVITGHMTSERFKCG